MNKRVKILIISLIVILVPAVVLAAAGWSGKDYHNENEGEEWGVKAENIVKIENPGRAYSLRDIDRYSAYISNKPSYVGSLIENAFYWFNGSRLAYVKLFKVEGGQSISFLFDKSIYLYCGEFNGDFVLIDDGVWGTNGTRYTLRNDTEWIMVVFRQVNGDLNNGAGLDTEISSEDILKGEHQYILFEPFQYNLELNGGSCMGKNGNIVLERLGVEDFTFPVPERTGYSFAGWKSEEGKIYNGIQGNEYDEELFRDNTFTALWMENGVTSVVPDREYIILEQNSTESYTLTATVLPENALNRSISYSSSNSEIAAVDSHGRITAGKTGVATITVSAANGVQGICTVYVMGFNVKVPEYCTLNESYEIRVDVYNNGEHGMNGRKQVIIDTDGEIELLRKGDDTSYQVVAESCGGYNEEFSGLKNRYLLTTEDSATVYYRLKSSEDIQKNGDYEGNVTFTVTVK